MLKLVMGNINYSSWSIRPWFLLRHSGLKYEIEIIPLFQDNYQSKIAAISPAKRVPILIDGDLVIHDSLAICEYLNDHLCGAFWPVDTKKRAQARAISAEMHAGFPNLRKDMSMNSRARKEVEISKELAEEIQRIESMWNDCRNQNHEGGPWLFGKFSIADAMYAPVVSRFETYGVSLQGEAQNYAAFVRQTDAYQEWMAMAKAETFEIPRYE